MGEFFEKVQISGVIGGRKVLKKWPENGVFRGVLKNILLWQRGLISRLEQFFKPNTMALAVFPIRVYTPAKTRLKIRSVHAIYK